MSMPLSLFALSPRQVAKWRTAVERRKAEDAAPVEMTFSGGDDDWGDVNTPRASEEPVDILDRAKLQLHLEWEHFGLSALLQRAEGRPSEPGLDAELFGRPDSEDPSTEVFHSAEHVRRLAERLGRITDERFAATWSDEWLITHEIYPTTAWIEPETPAMMAKAFTALRLFFEGAAKANNAVIVTVTV